MPIQLKLGAGPRRRRAGDDSVRGRRSWRLRARPDLWNYRHCPALMVAINGSPTRERRTPAGPGKIEMPAYFARDTWVVIAAFNEARAISKVIGGLVAEGFRVIVIDDGSADATAVVAANHGAIVIKHPFNLGQGAAIQTGLEAALLNGAEFLATFDADGQHRAGDVTRLIKALIKNHAHFALGSRFLDSPAVNLPPLRRVLLLLAALFTRTTTGLNVTDAHNGLRAMTREGAQCIRLRQNRMAHASEILNQIADCGLRYVEVPVTIEYNQYSIAKGQKSHELFMILLDLFARRLHQ